jgi:hypothetical protein
MATLVLGAVGSALGAGFGGTILGLSGAAIGGLVGSSIGSVVDSYLLASLTPGQRIEGARLDGLRITSATEGTVLPRLFGRMRLGGNIIWATDFREEIVTTETQGGGGKGGRRRGPTVTTTEYLYSSSFAVALCEGPITGIGRIWADGAPMDMSGVVWRWYPGSDTQGPDPLIAARMGAAVTPAYRGTAYVVFEDLALERYGNRLPQLSFEVFRPLAEADTAEGLVGAVTLIPASGEAAYATSLIRRDGAGAENCNALADVPDLDVSLDRLSALAPAVQSVSLVSAWFGDDLRVGVCTVKPKVEVAAKTTTPAWSVGGLPRSSYGVVSQIDGRPVYGGTPSDASIVEAIQELRARGKRVTFYPFVMMDVPPGNTLPNPYSASAAGAGQSVFPWRGRITCSPAAGFTGSPDKTAAAATQVAAFFGAALRTQFSVSGTTVTFTGAASDWGLRRMILHYAHLCAAAGGVDAFLIGTEMRGLTQIRSAAGTYPAVAAFQTLAADIRAILGPATRISYAADWSEYFGHQPQDGSNDVWFHLDPLWADANINFVGIDNYMPLSDWRDGDQHLDALAWPDIHDRAYLQANIAGGEGFDWFYASDAARAAQTRTTITDAGFGKPWVFRTKDIRSWWSNPHYNRPGGTESGSPTGWVPQSKPIWFTEIGCPAIDRGSNQPNVFVDPKSSESFAPHFSRGWRDDGVQRAYLEASWLFWGNGANNPTSGVYGAPMLNLAECAAWTWDARPYPFFPALSNIWADGANWRLGHWLTGRLGAVSLAALVRTLCTRAGLSAARIDVSGLWGAVEGYVISALESPRTSIDVLARHFGFDAVESEGKLRFVMRGRAPVLSITPDGMVAGDGGLGDGGKGEPLEIVRAQESELPQALKWTIARADEDYDAAIVEARRITVDSTRIAAEAFAIAVPPEEAERRCRRALVEAWVGRETATFRLPPSRLALDPCDVVGLVIDGRTLQMRIAQTADADARTLETVRQDREAYDLPPGEPRLASIARPVVFGQPVVEFMDLPQLREDVPAHRPYLAADAAPWPGALGVWRSPALDSFSFLTGVDGRARMGRLASALYPGPVSLFDLGNSVLVDLAYGMLGSVTDLDVLGGANAFALESAPGVWEILQAATAELVSPGRYKLSRLLRGQRGTEGAMVNPAPVGARIVALDDLIVPLPIAEAEIGLAWNWRVGPASRGVSDPTYTAEAFTPAGRGLVPFAPANVEQPWRTGRVPGDLTIRWVRRSRDLSADSWEIGEPPLAETAEAYEVEIRDGATLKRTLASGTTSVLYSAAAQTADFGAALTAGQSFTVRIFQVSARLGRGTPAIVTLFT